MEKVLVYFTVSRKTRFNFRPRFDVTIKFQAILNRKKKIVVQPKMKMMKYIILKMHVCIEGSFLFFRYEFFSYNCFSRRYFRLQWYSIHTHTIRSKHVFHIDWKNRNELFLHIHNMKTIKQISKRKLSDDQQITDFKMWKRKKNWE